MSISGSNFGEKGDESDGDGLGQSSDIDADTDATGKLSTIFVDELASFSVNTAGLNGRKEGGCAAGVTTSGALLSVLRHIAAPTW